MAGRELAIEWDGRPATAWIPDPLAGRSSGGVDDVTTVRLTERAAASVVRVGDRVPTGWEPLARLLLRAEGMASSNIAGLRATAAAVASADLGGASGTAGWVADNLGLIREALAEPPTPLDIVTLNAWHDRLMRRSTLAPELIGTFRRSQGWIGGRSPLDAAFVPPPPERIGDLMDDLITYANRDDLDPVVQAALLHAQFETIHPYGDGNGRVGRVLVLWVLARRLHVAVPPPMSTMIARDVAGYLSGLAWFRTGDEARWVRWFAEVLDRSAGAALEWSTEVGQVLLGWRGAIGDLRADAAGRRLVELLPAYPVISTDVAATQLGVSISAARTALQALADRGIVASYLDTPSGPGRPRRLWVAGELVVLITGWAG